MTTPSIPRYRELLTDEEKLRYDACYNPAIEPVLAGDFKDAQGHPLENNVGFQELAQKKLVYYAHCIALYDTPQEQRDLELLKALGFAVLNPNAEKHQIGYNNYEPLEGGNKMDYFSLLVDECDVLAFRAVPDGRIPAGVWYEIDRAHMQGIPVFEIPSGTDISSRRRMKVGETRAYLKEVGKR